MSERMMADAAQKVNGVNQRSTAKASVDAAPKSHATKVTENTSAATAQAYVGVIEQLLKRPIAFHRVFVTITKSVTAALMLSQAYYWKDKGHDPNGWFYKTQAEWKEETGLSRYEQEGARKVLRATKFWEEHKRGIPGKLYFRVNTKALFEAMQKAAANDRR